LDHVYTHLDDIQWGPSGGGSGKITIQLFGTPGYDFNVLRNDSGTLNASGHGYAPGRRGGISSGYSTSPEQSKVVGVGGLQETKSESFSYGYPRSGVSADAAIYNGTISGRGCEVKRFYISNHSLGGKYNWGAGETSGNALINIDVSISPSQQ